MLKDELMKQYEEIIIKLAICSAMEIEGKELIKKMEDEALPELSIEKLNEGLKGVYKAYDNQYEKVQSKKNVRTKLKMLCKVLFICSIPVVLFFILKEDVSSLMEKDS